MPRSSRHKSSKHSSKGVKDHSDSEKESSGRERKGKEESGSRASKEVSSGDKRKLESKDSKDYHISVNGEVVEEYTSSKRRKEKFDDGVNDRWDGGDDDRCENPKKSKSSGDKRRREDGEGDETRRGSNKNEGKNRESSRKENKEHERERDRERKYKEGKSDRSLDGDEYRGSKLPSEKSDLNGQDQLQSPDSEGHFERRGRRKWVDSMDRDKNHVIIEDLKDRHLSSRDSTPKDGKSKEEKQKDDKHRDKYQDDSDFENRRRGEKLRDDRIIKEHDHTRADERRDEKEVVENRRKKTKLRDGDYDRFEQDHVDEPDCEYDGYHERSRGHEHSRDRDRDRDRERDRYRGRGRREYERDWYHERESDRDRDNDKERSRDREKDRNRDYHYDRDKSDYDRERDNDRDGPYFDDQSLRNKEMRRGRRSPDDYDDTSRVTDGHYADVDARSGKNETDAEKVRSMSRQVSSSLGGTDEFRHIPEPRLKGISNREVSDIPVASERNVKSRTFEKSSKADEGHLDELYLEKSSSMKASPLRLFERSPSSTSLDRRNGSRNSARRSLEIEEKGQRSGASADDRIGRDLPMDKFLPEMSSQTDVSFYNRASQSNISTPRPDFRGGVGSPSIGSLDEDSRSSVNARYKRSCEPNIIRGQGAWRGAPNWPTGVPNGFIPFQHGPHGGFPSLIPQFPSPSLFGVRPSMDINHTGIPYHISDAERFHGHLRPVGWQNMMDGSSPHLHGWDLSSGPYRDESHMFGPEWDQNRHPMSGGVWESSTEAWKNKKVDMNVDVSPATQKDDYATTASVSDGATGVPGSSNYNILGVPAKVTEASGASPGKELSKSSHKTVVEKKSDLSRQPVDDDSDRCLHFYLSKLDISLELAGPELHKQSVDFLLEGNPSYYEEVPLLMNLKDDGKVLTKNNAISLCPLLFPAPNSSVFQRAVDLYKGQQAEVKGWPILDNSIFGFLSSKSPDKSREDTGARTVEGKNPAGVSEVSGASMSSEIHKEVAPVLDAAEEKLSNEYGTASCTYVMQSFESKAGVCLADVPAKTNEESPPLGPDDQNSVAEPFEEKSKAPIENHCDRKIEESGDKSNPVATEQHISEGAVIGMITNRANDNTEEFDEGTQVCGDENKGPVECSGASAEVSESLVPGSRESGSILSRIHNSPESTH